MMSKGCGSRSLLRVARREQVLRQIFPQFAQQTNRGAYMQQDAEELYSAVVNTLSQCLKEVGLSETRVLGVSCDGIGVAPLLRLSVFVVLPMGFGTIVLIPLAGQRRRAGEVGWDIFCGLGPLLRSPLACVLVRLECPLSCPSPASTDRVSPGPLVVEGWE